MMTISRSIVLRRATVAVLLALVVVPFAYLTWQVVSVPSASAQTQMIVPSELAIENSQRIAGLLGTLDALVKMLGVLVATLFFGAGGVVWFMRTTRNEVLESNIRTETAVTQQIQALKRDHEQFATKVEVNSSVGVLGRRLDGLMTGRTPIEIPSAG